MNSIRSIQKLNKQELEQGISSEGSWHVDYRDTAFIYVGGLPFDLSEGDIIAVFSQFGEPVWIKLARDRETGKSRGFCWIKYEDQRSTDLAVDNLGGATLMGRMLRVDHTRYKPRDDEDMRDNTMGELDADEDEWRRKRIKAQGGGDSDSDSDSDSDERPMLPEEIELARLEEQLDDDDPMKLGMLQRKQEEVDAALKKRRRAKQKERKHRSSHRRDHGSRERHRHREPRRIKEEDDAGSRRRRRSDSRDGHREPRRIKEEDDASSKPRHRSNSSNDHRGGR
ncbi:RNA-binding domain-containing protein, partial [Polyplosphaeria fusca]